MSPSCSRVEPLLSPYADGELADDEAALVREHVATCEGCSHIVDSHGRVRDRLLAAQFPALAPATAETLLARARTPAIRWGQLAAAVLVAALVPAAIAVTAPKPRKQSSCACDVIAPALDLGL